MQADVPADTSADALRTLRQELRLVQDRIEIETLLSRYARGVDRKDEAMIRSVYHPDAVDNHGSFDGPATEFVTQLMPRLRAMKVCFHGLCKSWIEISGDVAVSETYFVGFQRMPVPLPDGELRDMHQIGRYVDRLERRGGVWKIAHRQLVIEDTRIEPPADAGAIPPSLNRFMPGGVSPGDFAYQRWSELLKG